MAPEQITGQLADCKSKDRYVIDVNGDRFWVFGLPSGELLVRRIVDGIMKPLRTMQYDEVTEIEGMETESANQELMNAMQSAGRLAIVHIGDKPKAHKNDKPGSPQTSVNLFRGNGEKTSVLVCVGADGKSFRVVLDDVIHPIESGETLEAAVTRQQAELSRRLWPSDPQWQIVDQNEVFRNTLEGF